MSDDHVTKTILHLDSGAIDGCLTITDDLVRRHELQDIKSDITTEVNEKLSNLESALNDIQLCKQIETDPDLINCVTSAGIRQSLLKQNISLAKYLRNIDEPVNLAETCILNKDNLIDYLDFLCDEKNQCQFKHSELRNCLRRFFDVLIESKIDKIHFLVVTTDEIKLFKYGTDDNVQYQINIDMLIHAVDLDILFSLFKELKIGINFQYVDAADRITFYDVCQNYEKSGIDNKKKINYFYLLMLICHSTTGFYLNHLTRLSDDIFQKCIAGFVEKEFENIDIGVEFKAYFLFKVLIIDNADAYCLLLKMKNMQNSSKVHSMTTKFLLSHINDIFNRFNSMSNGQDNILMASIKNIHIDRLPFNNTFINRLKVKIIRFLLK